MISLEGAGSAPFRAMDPELFQPSSWLPGVEVINGRDSDHAGWIFEEHGATVAALTIDREKPA